MVDKVRKFNLKDLKNWKELEEKSVLLELAKNHSKILNRYIGLDNLKIIDLKEGNLKIYEKRSEVLFVINSYKREIIETINTYFGKNVIKEIYFYNKKPDFKIEDLITSNERKRKINIEFNEKEYLLKVEKNIDEYFLNRKETNILNKEILKQILIRNKKEEISKLEKGYKKCKSCNHYFEPKTTETICFSCENIKENEKIRFVKELKEKNEYIKYSEIKKLNSNIMFIDYDRAISEILNEKAIKINNFIRNESENYNSYNVKETREILSKLKEMIINYYRIKYEVDDLEILKDKLEESFKKVLNILNGNNKNFYWMLF